MPGPLYEQYGFSGPRSALAHSAGEAAAAAHAIGFPVALKVVAPRIPHKTDVGGVALDLRSAEEVAAAYGRLLAALAAHGLADAVEAVRVEEMVAGGQEIIIGLLNDPQFGPVIMFGLGGVFVELLGDVSFRVLPIARRDAEAMLREVKGRAVLEGYRGTPAVSHEMLVELLLNAGRMGMDLAPRLQAVDFNPILVRGDRHWVLDFKLELRDVATPLVERQPDVRHLDGFFNPAAVALVGASATPGKIGCCVLDSLARYEYRGRVYPINPGRAEIMGLQSYPTLSAAPDPVDMVVVTVGLPLVPGILQECAAKGVHNVVIISGGGKELGGEAGALEARIAELGRQYDLRIVGPNCIGLFDGRSRVDTFFQVRERMVRPPYGPLAILVQSGTVGAAVLERAERLGVTKFVSYGNRVDVDEGDLITYLADDPDTRVIACYIEGLADGRKFVQAARRVTRRKPIVVFKGGRTPRGARAAVSHTGFFGGSYALFRGAMRQAGVVTVDSIEELAAAAQALAMQPCAGGPRIAMISNGAGTMVQAIDLLEAYGLQIRDLDPRTVAHLQGIYPPFYLAQNPVDVTGSATSEDYRQGIEALLRDPNVDSVLPWFVFQDTPLAEDIAAKLGELSRRHGKPIVCGGAGGPYTQRMLRAIEAEGVPAYATVREWLAAAMALAYAAGAGDED